MLERREKGRRREDGEGSRGTKRYISEKVLGRRGTGEEGITLDIYWNIATKKGKLVRMWCGGEGKTQWQVQKYGQASINSEYTLNIIYEHDE